MKAGEKLVGYGLLDPKTGDLVLLPAPDGYCRAVLPDLAYLQTFLDPNEAIVKVTIEPLVEIVGGDKGSGNNDH